MDRELNSRSIDRASALNIGLHRVFGRLQVLKMSLAFRSVDYALYALGVAVVLVEGAVSLNGSSASEIGGQLLVGLDAAVFLVVLLVLFSALRFFFELRKNQFNYYFARDGSYRSSVIKKTLLPDDYLASGYQVHQFISNGLSEYYVSSCEIDYRLYNASLCLGGNCGYGLVLGRPYRLPLELRAYAPYVMGQFFKKHKETLIYNSSLLGLASDLLVDSKKIIVQKSSLAQR